MPCSNRAGQAAVPALRSFPLWYRAVSKWLGAELVLQSQWNLCGLVTSSPPLTWLILLSVSDVPGPLANVSFEEGEIRPHCWVQKVTLSSLSSLAPVQSSWGGQGSWKELTQGIWRTASNTLSLQGNAVNWFSLVYNSGCISVEMCQLDECFMFWDKQLPCGQSKSLIKNMSDWSVFIVGEGRPPHSEIFILQSSLVPCGSGKYFCN